MPSQYRSAATLRADLQHPVVDADGHWLEFGSAVREQMRRIGGERAAEGFAYYTTHVVKKVLALSREDRIARRASQPVWWGLPTQNTRDRATMMMPRLFRERMDEFGIDFGVLFPTAGLGLPRIPDDDVRVATCRAFNILSAETFEPFTDRMTPVAVIPMHHPEEAIAEIEFVRQELGLKVAMFGSLIVRPIPAFADAPPELRQLATFRDVLGLDSAFDYDPVWRRCVELGVSPTFHTGTRDLGTRISPTNFVYNHIGHFAAAGEAVCKALFLGGVTRRFPTLRFAFLEGGAGWACQLLSDLIEHWETRHFEALERLDPANLDMELFQKLAEEYGSAELVDALRSEGAVLDDATPNEAIQPRDDFAPCEIQCAADIGKLFTDSFYFGCEADDRVSLWAFDRRANPFGAQLNAIFGSDIGHFDVSNMSGVLLEAHELVEDGLLSETNFRHFVFENPVRLWGETNPQFFEGTVVAAEARAVLNE